MYSYTLTNILLSTRTLLNEVTASFWTDAILTGYINEGIRTIAQRSGCYRTTTTVSTATNVRTVSFTGYKCIAVEYNNEALIKITPLQVGCARKDGVYPQYWFEYGNLIGLEPVPPDIYTLTLYLASIPASLSAGSDVAAIPYALCGLITYYAVARALEQDRKLAPAVMLMSLFYNELDYMSKSILPNLPDGLQDLRFE
jgi:hypothetical protein